MTRRTMFHDAKEPSKTTRTIELSERDIRAAHRLLSLIIGEDEPDSPISTKLATDTSHVATVARARAEFENRRRRAHIFGPEMFGEPAWDMLLALFILDSNGPRQTAGALLQFSGVKSSTGKRWLDSLVESGLASRREHPIDARTYFVHLTDEGRRLLKSYFSVTIDNTV